MGSVWAACVTVQRTGNGKKLFGAWQAWRVIVEGPVHQVSSLNFTPTDWGKSLRPPGGRLNPERGEWELKGKLYTEARKIRE